MSWRGLAVALALLAAIDLTIVVVHALQLPPFLSRHGDLPPPVVFPKYQAKAPSIFAAKILCLLALLSAAKRKCLRHRHDFAAFLLDCAIGTGYVAHMVVARYVLGQLRIVDRAVLGFAFWSWTSSTRAHAPIAVLCGFTALVLLWQAVSEPRERAGQS